MTWIKHLLILPVSVLVIACGNKSDATTDPKADTTELAGVPFTRKGESETTLVMSHTIGKYPDWKAAFDLARPVRENHGIKTEHVYRGFADSNMAMVFTAVENMPLAKTYVNSPELKNSMNAAGVTGDMGISWLSRTLSYTQPITDTILIFMSFSVINYDRWEKAFLDDYRENPKHDFQVLNVSRGVDDPSVVYMLFAVNDKDYVEKMEKDNAFRMKMLASGVISYPVIHKLSEMPI